MTSSTVIPTEVIQCITTQQAWHYMILPYNKTENSLELFISNSVSETIATEELELLLGYSVKLIPKEQDVLKKEIARYYRQPADVRTQKKTMDLQKKESKDILNNLIQEAQQLGSSDIHLEPFEKSCKVRMRIDGVLVERYVLNKADYPSLVNKIKIHSNMDIAEKRLPQDGRIFFKINDTQKIDIRVSALPTLHGEKMVLRLLSNNAAQLDLNKLGFAPQDLDTYLEGIKSPDGIILISGPTGSGKTTSLYATLQTLNQTTRNIVTIEDPIEYTLEGINQVQLKENIGLNFPSALKTFLRQDPDVIMVGEIRDKDTASMAIRASLTGHLVLSTIHTNSAWGIVSRLIDMGIPSYLLADTLKTAVAQRLVRLLCNHCKKSEKFDNNLYPRKFKAPQTINHHYVACGCEQCYYTGYSGRSAIYEVIPIDHDLSDLIKKEDLKVSEVLREKGIQNLAFNAFQLLLEGKTSIKEIYPILLQSH